MSRNKMIIIWLAGSAILTVLFTAALGVLGRISLLEYTALFIGGLFVVAFGWLLFRILLRLTSK